jgi:NitT/TauT family transport system permease protein
MTTETITQDRERSVPEAEKAKGGAKRVQRRARFIQVASVVGVLVIWEIIVRVGGIEPIFLPSVTFILKTFWSMTWDGTLPWNTLVTVMRILTGFFAAVVFGVVIGIGMGMSKTFQNICDPLIAALYPLPKITLIPLLIIWLGTGESYKFVVSAFTAFFPIVISTYIGLKQVDEGLVQAARDLGANERQVQMEVMMPAAVPSIFGGFRLGMGVAIILTVASEMIASQNGLGRILIEAGSILETEKIFASLFVMAILGIVVTKAQDWVDMRFASWAFESRER